MNIKKCVIKRYDETITEPPFLTIPVDEMEIEQPIEDHLGERLWDNIAIGCRRKGYAAKFYTMSKDKKYDYEVVVY